MRQGFGSLWMMSEEKRPKLLQIALADNAVTEIPIDDAAGEFHRTIVGEGAVWVSANSSQTIYKIDPKTNLVVLRIPADFRVSNQSGEIGVGEGAVWAITGNDNQMLRGYSVQTGAEQAAIPLPSPSRGVVIDFGSIWIAGTIHARN